MNSSKPVAHATGFFLDGNEKSEERRF